jgi:arabinofuranosyltransferase
MLRAEVLPFRGFTRSATTTLRPSVPLAALALSLLTLVCRVAYIEWSSGGGDDAFITYRYAENIARGYGFVFNPGGPAVLGTTTPLYTLLLALGAKLGAPIPTLSLALGAVASAIAVGLLVLTASELGFAAAGIAIGLTWALSPVPAAAWAGMETPLYLALIVGAFYAGLRGRLTVAFALAALAAVTRPDGVAVVAATAALAIVRHRWSWRSIVPGTLILLAWIVFATITFGSPVPNSGLAKMQHDPVISGTFLLLDPSALDLVLPIVGVVPSFETLAHVPLPDGASLPVSAWLLGVLVIAEGIVLGLLTMLRRVAAGWPILLWIVLYTTGYTLLHVPNFPWYYAPLGFVGGLVFWMGTQHLLTLLVRNRAFGARLSIGLAAALAALTIVAFERGPTPTGPHPHAEAGAWLRDHAQPGQTVAAYEVGTLAYVSDLQTIDILGLTEPQALPFLQRGDYGWAVRLHPDYIFTVQQSSWPVIAAIYDEPEFSANYALVARFASQPGRDYLLYQRHS